MIPLCVCSQIRFVLDGGTVTIAVLRKFSRLLSKEARQISDFAPPGWEASPLDGFEGLLSTQQLRTVERQWNVKNLKV